MNKLATCLLCIAATCTSLTLLAQQQKANNNNSLLWKISGNHLAKPSYVFGTMHAICQGDVVWPQTIDESLSHSDRLCLEMNMSDPKVIAAATDGFIDLSGKKLSDYFTPAQYKALTAYFHDSLNMDLALFQQLKPLALMSVAAMKEGNCEHLVSYEDSLMKIASKETKEICGLEQAQEQLDILNTMPIDSVINQIMDQVQDRNKNDSEYQQLIVAYKNQDLVALSGLIADSKELGNDPAIFLDDRNKKWIPRMEGFMNGKSVFFAVGAGHLWGQNGVINLLRSAGYTVEPQQ